MDANRVRQLSEVIRDCNIDEYLQLKYQEDPDLSRIRHEMEAIKSVVISRNNVMFYSDFVHKGKSLRNALCGRSRPECIPFAKPEKRNEDTFIKEFQKSSNERCNALSALDEEERMEDEARRMRCRRRALKRRFPVGDEE